MIEKGSVVLVNKQKGIVEEILCADNSKYQRAIVAVDGKTYNVIIDTLEEVIDNANSK